VSKQTPEGVVEVDERRAGGALRLTQLDGLRGVGAFVVVLYHCVLVVPAMAQLLSIGPYPAHTPAAFSVQWWLDRTPLRLVWGGHEAVLVFFVLSGFVLTLPLRPGAQGGRGWSAYYVRRLLRLYVPVWGALVLAYALASAVTRDTSFGSTWLRVHPQPHVATAVKDAILVRGVSNLDSPLWSLQWEVLFSLLLPVFVVILWAIRVERWWRPAIVLLAMASVLAEVPAVRHALPQAWITDGLLQYMPVFVIGMVLCLVRARLSGLWQAIRPPMRTAIIVAVVVLVPARSYVSTGPGAEREAVTALLGFVAVLAVAVLVVLALVSSRVSSALRTRPMQWLGTRSFSIYLIHEPIVVSAALLLHADSPWPWALIAVVVIAVSLLMAEGFYRVVERPAHLLSRAVGRRVQGRRPVAA